MSLSEGRSVWGTVRALPRDSVGRIGREARGEAERPLYLAPFRLFRLFFD